MLALKQLSTPGSGGLTLLEAQENSVFVVLSEPKIESSILIVLSSYENNLKLKSLQR